MWVASLLIFEQGGWSLVITWPSKAEKQGGKWCFGIKKEGIVVALISHFALRPQLMTVILSTLHNRKYAFLLLGWPKACLHTLALFYIASHLPAFYDRYQPREKTPPNPNPNSMPGDTLYYTSKDPKGWVSRKLMKCREEGLLSFGVYMWSSL